MATAVFGFLVTLVAFVPRHSHTTGNSDRQAGSALPAGHGPSQDTTDHSVEKRNGVARLRRAEWRAMLDSHLMGELRSPGLLLPRHAERDEHNMCDSRVRHLPVFTGKSADSV